MSATVARHGGRPRHPRFGWLSLLAPLFVRVLDRLDARLQHGSIDATLPDGGRRLLGGRAPGPAAIVELRSWRALLRLVSGGSAGWYEAWANGEWSSPDPVTLFELFVANRHALGDSARAGGIGRMTRRIMHGLRRNSRAGAKRNVQAHYDLGNDFYAAWLDGGLTYSSAMFAEPVAASEPLATAQTRKLAAILDRTNTAPGDAILEIGCGWGSFVAHAANAGRTVHAITLSDKQLHHVSGKIASEMLPGASVELRDYREIAGCYDAVVSIEMVEAVGQEYWPDFLKAVAAALKPGGRAALQFISIDDAIFEAYARNVDFIQAYVFPGGMLLSEQRFRAAAESAGLVWQDQHRFGQHYAETLRRWRAAFDAAALQQRLPASFNAERTALWRYYLMYCEGGFRGGGIEVSQVTLAKPA
ncbi:MAG: class I SAM-dependent methyltransferase [Sphingomonas sp.]